MNPKAFALFLGLVGGAVTGPWIYTHLFHEGLTDEERKQLLGFGLATSTLLIASQFQGVEEWLSVEGLSAKVDKFFAKL